jgi:epoxyqueuosine reductase
VLVAELSRALAPFGLNLIGLTTPEAYDALVPESHRFGRAATSSPRTIVVVGNGGGRFWTAYREHATGDPDAASHAHPLDDFTMHVLETHALPIAERLAGRVELRLPFRATLPPLSFVHLAEAAGLGRRGLLGVLIHPEFGPWMALRGALLVDAALPPAARPAAGFDPCPACRDRPCIAACPGEAVTHPGGWNVPACIAFRVERGDDNPCEDRCHARVACVYGRRYRYPADALAYHQRRAFAVMRGAR